MGINSAALIAAMFAIMQRGGVAVPMNTKFPEELLNYVTEDAAISRTLVDDHFLDALPDTTASQSLPDLGSATGGSTIKEPEPGQPALVLYTSGSTGRPKGVLLSHDSQLAMVDRMKDVLREKTGIVAAPLYHMNGLLFCWSLMAGGGTVVLMPRFEARKYLQAIHDYRVDILTGVPTMLSLILKEQDLIASLDLSCVKAISVGSAPLSETLIELDTGVGISSSRR